MRYIPLNKQYYLDREAYEQVYQQRLNGADTIKLGLSVHGWPAFLCRNVEMYQLTLEIHKLDKRVRSIRQELPEIALSQFARRCLIDEVVLTNNIEGVSSTRKEINEALGELHSQRSQRRFSGLVKGYALLQQGETLPLSTCEDVRRLYDRLVLPEVISDHPDNAPDGKIFRKGAVTVTSSTQKVLHQGAYPESEVIALMERGLALLGENELELLFRVGCFHYLLGYIHPFYDGNGRLSRFISSYLLSRELDPLIGYRLSYTIQANTKKYYDAFKTCNHPRSRGDVTPFVIAFLEIIKEAMEQLEAALERRKQELAQGMEELNRRFPAEQEKELLLYQILLQASLFSDVGISTQDLLACTNLSRSTLAKRLAAAQEEGLLVCRQYGTQKFYQLALEK